MSLASTSNDTTTTTRGGDGTSTSPGSTNPAASTDTTTTIGGESAVPSSAAMNSQARRGPAAAAASSTQKDASTAAGGSNLATPTIRGGPASRGARKSRGTNTPCGIPRSRNPSPNGSARPGARSSSSLSELEQQGQVRPGYRQVPDRTGNASPALGSSPSTRPPPRARRRQDPGANSPGPPQKQVSAPPKITATPPAPEESESELPEEGMKTPRSNSAIAALETVRESSLPTTPAIGPSRFLQDQVAALAARQQQQQQQYNSTPMMIQTSQSSLSRQSSFIGTGGRTSRAPSIASSFAPSTTTGESESESGYRSEDRTPTGSVHNKPVTQPPTQKFPRRPTVLGKESSSRGGMTVETETVSAVPQGGLDRALMGQMGERSIRSKKSTDTIRAPRERKKKKRTQTMNPNPSSRADIFAARIAEAVDEANSSDSDETFVYESNPPDHPQRPTSRFHSRTPSASSMGGPGPDPRGLRLPLLDPTADPNRTIRGKGMKFVSNREASLNGGESSTNLTSTTSNGEPSSSREPRERRNGRHRNIINHSDDSPFRTKPSHHNLRHQGSSIHGGSSRAPSQPPSPSLPPSYRSTMNSSSTALGKRSSSTARWTSYEADVEAGDGEDEMTPLMAARRNHQRRRANHPPPPRHPYNPDDFDLHPYSRRGWMRTYASCLIAFVAILTVMTGIGGFLFTTTNPLQEVAVMEVKDVLVSKEEIMMNLVIRAVNLNIVGVVVGSGDLNVFAKSAHLRDGDSDKPKLPTPTDPDGDPWILTADEKDEGTSPPDEEPAIPPNKDRNDKTSPPDKDPPTPTTTTITPAPTSPVTPPPDNTERETMLLGRIFTFDSPLIFDGHPFTHTPQLAVAEMRLSNPGNRTEEGGSERWDRVRAHRWELIIRGVVRYQLPLERRWRAVGVMGRVWVEGEGEEGGESGSGSEIERTLNRRGIGLKLRDVPDEDREGRKGKVTRWLGKRGVPPELDDGGEGRKGKVTARV